METKVLQVFYGKDCLPYKDKERSVHFPIIGAAIQGASNTTKIRFYFDELVSKDDETTTWVVVSKLPNGKIGSEIVGTALDEELNEQYALFTLKNFYTQAKGDLFLSLQGYQGGVQVETDPDTGISQIIGTPTIQATGSIKLAINYATQLVGSGETSNINFQKILADLGTKLGIRAYTERVTELPTTGQTNVFYAIYDDPNNPNKLNIYVWNGTTQSYVWIGDNTLYLGDYYTQEQGDQFESDINNRVTSVENELSSVASGSPKGVYATLSDLESAYPTGTDGIYIVQANGHWYYWNGSAWTDGGVYLSSASDKKLNATSTNSVTNEVLTILLGTGKFIETPSITWTNNTYFTAGGTIVSGGGSTIAISSDITLKKGQTIAFFCNAGSNIGVLCKKIGDSSYTGLIAPSSSGNHFYTYVATEDMQVALCTYQYDSIGAGYIIYKADEELKDYSENPIQNKPVATKINELETKTVIDRKEPSYTNGYYLSGTSDTFYPNASFKYSEPVYFKKWTKINVKAQGYSTVVNIVSLWNESNNTYYEKVRCTDGVYKWYSYTVQEDGYYIFCSSVGSDVIIYAIPNDSEKLTLLENNVDLLEKEINLTWNESYYISGTGDGYYPHNNYHYSNPVYIGSKCTLNVYARAETQVNILSKTSEPNGSYYKEIQMSTENVAKWYKIRIDEPGYYIICDQKTNNTKIFITLLENSQKQNILSVFSRLVFCGDSLTYGLVYTSATTYRQAIKPINEAVTDVTGISSERYATAGYTSIDWWNNYNNRLNENALYFIFLGTNGGLTDTIDTDCVGNDPDNFADNTNTGCYGKILQTLRNNNRQFVLIKPPATNATTQSVIEKFGVRYNVPVISLPPDLSNSFYHYAPGNYSYQNVIHYNDIGYNYIANCILYAINNMSERDLFQLYYKVE